MPDEHLQALDHTASGHSGHSSDQPASEPPAASPRGARFRPPGRRRPSTLPTRPPRELPDPGIVTLNIRLSGPERELIRLVKRLSRVLPVQLCVDVYTYLPDEVWHQFPSDFLNPNERALVREDLRFSTTREIERNLHISAKTVQTYRNNIRTKFLTIAPALRPAWMDAWLRRFPGLAVRRARAQQGEPPSDEQGEQGEAE